MKMARQALPNPDIFISYSKADHALALKLSAFLEAEGWTVWWDKSLAAADLYRDEIMEQLAAARAVITIWSPAFFAIITFGQLGHEFSSRVSSGLSTISVEVIMVAPWFLLRVAPANAISRRLIFLALGLLLLIGLNELSKLGLDVTAPKLRG